MTDEMERIEPDRAEVSSLRTPELDLKDPPKAGGAVRRNRPALAQGCGTTTAALPESDMAKAVGEPGWWRLKPEIQERFAKDVKAGQIEPGACRGYSPITNKSLETGCLVLSH